MKKAVSMILALVLMLSLCAAASAAGKLVVSSENMVVVESYSYYYAYVFAEVTNKGDKPVQYNACLMEVLDENGEVLGNRDYGNCYPKYLNPGETGYLVVYDSTDDKSVVPADYTLTVTGKSASENPIKRLPATVQVIDVPRGYGNYVDKVAVITVTNDTDLAVLDYTVVYIARDTEGNIICVTDGYTGNSGILPGGSILNKLDLRYESTLAAADEAGIAYTIEAIAFINE